MDASVGSSSTAGYVDFKAISSTAIRVLDTIVPLILPGGYRKGREWIVRNPTRNDATPGSFSVNLQTGIWADFATGATGGEVVAIFRRRRHPSPPLLPRHRIKPRFPRRHFRPKPYRISTESLFSSLPETKVRAFSTMKSVATFIGKAACRSRSRSCAMMARHSTYSGLSAPTG